MGSKEVCRLPKMCRLPPSKILLPLLAFKWSETALRLNVSNQKLNRRGHRVANYACYRFVSPSGRAIGFVSRLEFIVTRHRQVSDSLPHVLEPSVCGPDWHTMATAAPTTATGPLFSLSAAARLRSSVDSGYIDVGRTDCKA